MSTLLGKNGTTIGSKLQKRMEELEKRIQGYPFEIAYNHIADKKQRNGFANVLDKSISYIEVGIGLYKNFHNGKIEQQMSFLENPFTEGIMEDMEVVTDEVMIKAMSFEDEKLVDARVNNMYIAIGKPHFSHGQDGDTVTIAIEYAGKNVKGKLKKEESVRYIGLQTAETDKSYLNDKSAVEYSNMRNAAYAQYFGLTVPEVYEIAEEAAVLNATYLGADKEYLDAKKAGKGKEKNYIGNKYILVHLDRDASGELIYTHERPVGVLFQTDMTKLEDVIKAINSGTASFRNINKSMLVAKSSKYSPAPLGYMEYDSVYGKYNDTVLNPLLWPTELGIKMFDPGTNAKPTGVSPDILPDIDVTPQDDVASMDDALQKENDSYAVEYSQDYISNVIDTIKPLDDRFDEIFTYTDDGQYFKDSRVRIGDVLLTIPPLSIQVQKNSNISRSKTLRTKSAVMTNSGRSDTKLSMELYFHDMENINGIERKYGDYTFYMDSLRTLLAQFSKCPFVPIDNPYVNNVLNIHAVALLDLTVSTVPGFPNSISASITLQKFEHKAFMPTVPFLGEAINYPLMRWYYQQALRDRGNGRTYFQPTNVVVQDDGTITSNNLLTNDFKFKIANRSMLEARQNAISSLNSMDTPEKIREDAKAGQNEWGIMLGDIERASAVIQTYDKYLKAKGDMSTYSIIETGEIIKLWAIGYKDKFKLTQEQYENAIAEGPKFFEDIYGSHLSVNGNEFFAYELPQFYTKRIGLPDPIANEYQNQNLTGNIVVPDEVLAVNDIRLNLSDGYFQIGLKSASNQAEFKQAYRADKSIDGAAGFYLPANYDTIAKLRAIAGKKAEVEKSLDDYEEGYRQQEQLVNLTENDIPMEDFPIDGFLPISMNVMYSNQFTPLPVLESATPALQYLGSQEPYIQMTFEVDDVGLTQVNELLEKVDEYARVYRQGISTGFLGVENQLTRLFGIRSVMIESAQYSTVPNFPDRNQVQMTLVGFDKTQRRAEDIAGFSAATKDTSLKDVENNGMQEKSDRIVEMRLRKMEVYPDLELPTYGELNSAIGKLKMKDIPEVLSKTGSYFVDPDFYVSTPWTFREALSKDYLGDHALYLKDSSGLQVMTSPNSDRIIDASESAWDIINRLSTETAKVESAFKWGNNSNTETDNDGDGKKEPVTFKSKDISDYMLTKDDKGVYNFQKPPTVKEVRSWGLIMDDSEYSKWVDTPNPKESEVWQYIYYAVKKQLAGSKRVGGGTDWHKRQDLTSKETNTAYRSSKAMYAVVYQARKDELSKDDLKKLKKRTNPDGGAAGDFKEPKLNEKSISEDDFAYVSNQIPFERVFSMVKALFHFSSKWKQFTNKGLPLIDVAHNSVGIGGVPIADAAETIGEAKRLIWDWHHNLDAAIKKVIDAYNEAYDGDKIDKIEFRSRPWEAMIYAYANGKQPSKSEQLDKDGITNSVLDIFYKFYNSTKRWGTPSRTFDIDLYSSAFNLSTRQRKLVEGKASKADYIKILVDDLAYRWPMIDFYSDPHLATNGKKKKEWDKFAKDHADWDNWGVFQLTDFRHAEFTKVLLKEESDTFVKNLFTKTLKDIKNDKDWKANHPVLGFLKDGIEGLNHFLGAPEASDIGEQLSEEAGGALIALENSADRLVGDDDPQQLYREMYTDLITHDHRGRLLRAFPGFQMLIIDEGKWMGRFKFWDNMYGFNAIESIDVYKSRKIAADTAVIRMTNVYSNLTSKRPEFNYQEHKSDVWTNLIFENPSSELLDVRKELLRQMMLETGARIHLRMGYGSDAASMPIVFNGTVTEIDTQEVVEIVCQGDGVELGNILSGDPDDDNNGFFQVTEPRDLICELLTSKGSWFKDVINVETEGVFFRDNPTGIMHFGIPGSIAPAGNLWLWNTDYGEAAQNVYSSNGTPTFSQWTHPDGSSRNLFSGSFWSNITSTNITRWFQPGDEDNIIVKFYNNTTWDIIQTLAYCSLDYIAAVHPFETRSTLFFGKPYWRMARSYNSTYNWDASEETWMRKVNSENRRPYMQFRYYDSHQDIISNAIKVSEDGVYTNVIVNYDNEQTPILSADYDIRYDKQKTQVVNAEIVARFPGIPGGDFATSEHQARNYGMSWLRDSLKDMYKGSLTVIGDPSVKPYDAMYLSDFTSTMNGVSLVKAVTHHMSLETGFVTSIEPDAYVVNDDLVLLSAHSWLSSAAIGFATLVFSFDAVIGSIRKIQKSKTIGKLVKSSTGVFHKLEEMGMKAMLSMMDSNDVPAVRAYKNAFEEYHKLPRNADAAVRNAALDKLDNAADDLTKYVDSQVDNYKNQKGLRFFNKNKKEAKEALKDARFLARKSKALGNALRLGKASKGLVLKSAFTAGRAIFSATGIGAIIDLTVTIATEGIFEMYARYKEALQCVTMIPLRYKGMELTAGINGHMGMVVGDNPGKLDKLVSAVAFEEDESDKDGQGWYNWVFETMNFLSGSDKNYSVKQEDLAQNPTGKE